MCFGAHRPFLVSFVDWSCVFLCNTQGEMSSNNGKIMVRILEVQICSHGTWGVNNYFVLLFFNWKLWKNRTALFKQIQDFLRAVVASLGVVLKGTNFIYNLMKCYKFWPSVTSIANFFSRIVQPTIKWFDYLKKFLFFLVQFNEISCLNKLKKSFCSTLVFPMTVIGVDNNEQQ